MATSRKLPTSYNTSTYDSGDGTKDYTSLSTWEAATDTDLVTATNGEVLECYSSQDHDDDNVILYGTTTNSSYFRVIKPASGEGHDGTPDNGVTFAIANTFVTINEANSRIHDIIVKNSLGSNSLSSMGDNTAFVGCIVVCPSATGFELDVDPGTAFIINCIVIDATYGILANDNNLTLYCYNCTVVNADTGYHNAKTATVVAKNCISCDNTSDFTDVGTAWTKTTCYEGDATVFADQAGDDYHLGSSDTTARGNGTDLSSDGNYAFDDDIDGQTRSFWDIGADENLSTGWSGKCLNVSSIAKINNIAVADIAKVNAVA